MNRFFLIIFFFVFSCNKDNSGDLQKNLPPLAPNELTATLVTISEIKLNWNDKSTDEKGFKIERKTANSDFSILKVVGADTSTYIDKGLAPNTTYTYRVLSFNDAGNSKNYSNEVSLLTVTLPALTTLSISDTSYNTAKSGGNITSDGGLPITERGLVWSTQPNPTIDLSTKITSGNGPGEFKIDILGLLPNTLYYIRSFAKNSQGIGYGNEMNFKTKPLTVPVVQTILISSITETGAISGGNVLSDGGTAVTSRGLVWSTIKPIESLLDTKTQNGFGLGAFSSSITNLQPNTPYYIRAYATNSQGTAFGEMINFTTKSNLPLLTSKINKTVWEGDENYKACDCGFTPLIGFRDSVIYELSQFNSRNPTGCFNYNFWVRNYNGQIQDFKDEENKITFTIVSTSWKWLTTIELINGKLRITSSLPNNSPFSVQEYVPSLIKFENYCK